MSFDNFLKDFDHALHSDYRVECFKEKYGHEKREKPKEIPKEKLKTSYKKREVPDIFSSCEMVIDLPDDHPAKVYLLNRDLPKQHLKMFWYVEKFYKWASGNSDKFDPEMVSDLKDHPRIVFPWYSEDKTLFGYQARSLGEEKPKYYTVFLESEEKFPKIFGMDRVDRSKPVLVVEGGLDSLFLPNCVAVGDANLSAVSDTIDKESLILISDNEPRNLEILKIYQKNIKNGFRVFIPPDNYEWKDINDAIIKGNMSRKDVLDVIGKNIYHGLSATLRFNKWKKMKI